MTCGMFKQGMGRTLLVLLIWLAMPVQAEVSRDAVELLPANTVRMTALSAGWDRRTGEATYTVQLTNASTETLTAPVYIEIVNINPDGIPLRATEEQFTDGAQLYVINEDLAPQASVQKKLIFHNPNRYRFLFDTNYYQTPGDEPEPDLDGDGIPDSSDPDRDGDGVSNTDEQAAGADPNDPTSVPDTNAPQIEFDIADNQTTEGDSFQLSGGITDDVSGLATFEATSDRYPTISFNPVVSAPFWVLDVPLEVGANKITFTAVDAAGNSAQQVITIHRQAVDTVVTLAIDSPAANTVFADPVIIVKGRVITEELPETIAVTVQGLEAQLSSTNVANEIAYASPDLVLQEGANTVLVEVQVNDKQRQASVTVVYQPVEEAVAAPAVLSVSPASGSYLNSESFTWLAELTAPGGLSNLAINGQSVAVTEGATQMVAEHNLAFNGGFTLPVQMQITDLLGQTTEAQWQYHLDSQPPAINLTNDIAPLPVENLVTETPFILQGQVKDNNLAALILNGDPVSLTPGADNGEYSFSIPLSLNAQTANLARLQAFDFAGNTITQDYSLQLQYDLNVEILRPADNAQFVHNTEPLALAVAARIEPASALYNAEMSVINSAGTALTTTALEIEGALASGSISLPALADQYELNLRVFEAGTLVVQTTHRVSVTDPVVVPVRVEKTTPTEGSRYVEPNSFIAVFFNQPIDDSLLRLEIFETAHGMTYVDMDEKGTDAIRARGFKLTEVHRDHQPVPGAVSLLTGNKAVAFYPERSIAYNADVYLNVIYDGKPLKRMHFQTRDLPTFIEGGVTDQLGQPVTGVDVAIPQLNRRTTTDSEGFFKFGYQENAEDVIPSGRYELVINGNLKNNAYGSLVQWVNLQKGVRNTLGRHTLPILNKEVPFSYLESGKEAVINGGEVRLDLTGVRLLFHNTRESGAVHIQFTPLSRVSYPIMPNIAPLWIYSAQPAGVKVEGDLQFSFDIPKYQGSYDYAPKEGELVVLLGLDGQSKTIVPMGVGRAVNYRIQSEGPNHYQTLDVFAYFRVTPMQQADLQAYLDGTIGWPELNVRLQTFELTLPEQN